MDIQYFKEQVYNPATFIPAIRQEWKSFFEWKAFLQYDPLLHKILVDKVTRPDKFIQVPIPNQDCADPDQLKTETKTVHIARIPLALQRLIVSRAVAFLTGGKTEVKAKPANETEQALFDWVMATWRKNKLQFKNADIAKRFMSETECAEIWYSKKREDGAVDMRMQVFSPSKGDELIPVFDPLGDLLAFARGYVVEEGENKITYMDVYDDKKVVYYRQAVGSEWEKIREVAHLYGKIPVIYYSLERSVWSDVQIMIERLETLISNFADTNDYNGSPILFAKGKINGFSQKGEAGKVIQGEDGIDGQQADIRYITWDKAPEAIKLEIETLTDMIYTITQTPNLSLKELRQLGDISGVAFDRMLIDAHLKAKDYQNGMYGEGIQRRLNFLLAAGIATQKGLEGARDMEIGAEFTLYRIDDINSRIDTAMKANGGLPVMSQKESISFTQLSDDPDKTLEDINAQNEPVANNEAPN